MKKITLTLLVMLISTIALAQKPNGQGGNNKQSIEERQEKELKQLTKTLDLSQAQIDSITILQDKLAIAIEEKRSSFDKSDRDAMRKEMTIMRDNYYNDVRELLDEDQQKKYDKYISKQKAKQQERVDNQRGQGHGGGQGRQGGGGRNGGGQGGGGGHGGR